MRRFVDGKIWRMCISEFTFNVYRGRDDEGGRVLEEQRRAYSVSLSDVGVCPIDLEDTLLDVLVYLACRGVIVGVDMGVSKQYVARMNEEERFKRYREKLRNFIMSVGIRF